MEEKGIGESRWPLLAGTAVAVIPLVGYLAAYCDAWGRAHYFGYPRDLIAIDLGTAVAAGVPAAISVLLLVLLAATLGMALRMFSLGWLVDVVPFLLFLPLLGLAIDGLTYRSHTDLIVQPIFAAAVGIPLLFVAYTRRNEESVLPSPFLGSAMLRWLVYAAVTSIVIFGSIYETGLRDARRQRVFLTLAGNPPSAVVGVYGNRIIEAAYEPKLRCLTGSYRVVELSQRPLTGSRTAVGGLRRC